jgi:DNA-binding MarR family transcriptional regulator
MVDRLEERGYVERRMLASDRRVKTVALTPLGAKAKAELLARLSDPPAALVELPVADLATLRAAMAKLSPAPALDLDSDGMHAPHPCPHPPA